MSPPLPGRARPDGCVCPAPLRGRSASRGPTCPGSGIRRDAPSGNEAVDASIAARRHPRGTTSTPRSRSASRFRRLSTSSGCRQPQPTVAAHRVPAIGLSPCLGDAANACPADDGATHRCTYNGLPKPALAHDLCWPISPSAQGPVGQGRSIEHREAHKNAICAHCTCPTPCICLGDTTFCPTMAQGYLPRGGSPLIAPNGQLGAITRRFCPRDVRGQHPDWIV